MFFPGQSLDLGCKGAAVGPWELRGKGHHGERHLRRSHRNYCGPLLKNHPPLVRVESPMVPNSP